MIYKKATGPLGTPVNAAYGLLGDGKTAVIEMAEASGLHLVPPKLRNPLLTTSRGTGELILDAVEKVQPRLSSDWAEALRMTVEQAWPVHWASNF